MGMYSEQPHSYNESFSRLHCKECLSKIHLLLLMSLLHSVVSHVVPSHDPNSVGKLSPEQKNLCGIYWVSLRYATT